MDVNNVKWSKQNVSVPRALGSSVWVKCDDDVFTDFTRNF